jgi:REP element-mobilizing transposase RayT
MSDYIDHHRRSIRLKGYDYSSPGAYFITICSQNREFVFGSIKNGEMILNDAGQMADRWWNELKNKFVNIRIDEYVVMPNHIHGLLHIYENPGQICDDGTGQGQARDDGMGQTRGDDSGQTRDANPGQTRRSAPTVGANLCVRPNLRVRPGPVVCPDPPVRPDHVVHPNQCIHPNIPRIIQWYKTMTTNEYIRNVKQNGWRPFDGKLWQRNYYEQIVRDDGSLIRIRKYVSNNPSKWEYDSNNPDKMGARSSWGMEGTTGND